jgi:glutamate-5-semialdehyde dehydrogenase
MQNRVQEQLERARIAARQLAKVSTDTKNRALHRMADALLEQKAPLLEANAADVAVGQERGLADALVDRLTLNAQRLQAMAEGLRQVAALPDPVGQVLEGQRRPNGLELQVVRVPLGVVAVVYESRPNVTADAAALGLKSGNALILRGGSEALRTNLAIARLLAQVGEQAGLPPHCLQLIETADRDAALALMRAEGYVDVLIPRGGESLKKTVLENAFVPVLTALGGNCHVYLDAQADLAMAQEIAFNAKVSRPGVCNAMETLLVHQQIARDVLPALCARLAEAGVELRGCARAQQIVPGLLPASETDWETEYLALILAIRVVDSLDEAIDHITRYGTQHSEAIVTQSYAAAQQFVQEVDAACVYVNASTRYTDGYELGMGAEVGISTQKLHARGPMGLVALTTTKMILRGNGQVRW